MPTAGTLYLVSTPIGNLADITYRAVDVLRKVALIAAEDTRHTRHLLSRYDIRARLESFHEHSEAERIVSLITTLEAGGDVALVSDAGTPLLSDPGSRLVTAAIERGLRVVPIPGASALLAALVGSGLEMSTFTFLGFLPRRGREREEALAFLSGLPHTGVLYEAPTRVAGTLADLVRVGCGSRRCVVGRELTKQYEEFRRGTVSELSRYYVDNSVRGEIVLVLEGQVESPVDTIQLARVAHELRAQGYSSREVASMLRDAHGAPRNVAYRLAHETT